VYAFIETLILSRFSAYFKGLQNL